MLLDRGDTPGRALLFKDLNTPVDVATELKDSPDFTSQVFRFLSRTIACIAVLSLLLLPATAGRDRLAILWFSGITLLASLLLSSIHGRKNARDTTRKALEAQSMI
jgi:hypothetical protein